ncbi:response regulator [Cohnella phaseoli]|uniref:Two-component system response regulator YesN n=1 Tax=Cohnella phaseoli TaxID=456490 RepID=A0A3D9I3Z2_9BACL|nr:response regulator [Cohnella phaseoli]RED55876.1 two-component system response regulator YesN [Cohnella phaseoli]
MYRLLIVDDMPIITDGLAKLFRKELGEELDIVTAYSGIEALDLLERERIDIVLSDILMPGLDGIELLKEIHDRWSACKVILLTSHSDFNYVQSALSLGGLEYILKTESDDKIVLAVRKAIQALDKDADATRLIRKAEEHMRLALPTLQKEYLSALIQGKKVGQELLAEHFANLRLSLRAEQSVLLLVGRIDDWNEIMKAPDKSLIVYAVQNIVEELLAEFVLSISLVYESSKIIWLIQSRETEKSDREAAFRGVNGMLEHIQGKCAELLKQSVSFVLAREETPWNEASDRFHELTVLLARGLGGRKGALLTEPGATEGKAGGGLSEGADGRGSAAAKQGIRQLTGKIPLLLSFLESGNEEEFARTYEELAPVFADESFPGMRKIELYHALCYVFLTFVNKYGLENELSAQADWNKLVRYDDGVSWHQWYAFFGQLASLIFAANREDQEQSTHDVVRKVHEFIETNLSADLSLIQLADHVHLNPSYLSRLYKQMTGTGLSEYMSDFRDRKAKELLTAGHLKVHEIAAKLGYNSSHAFIRFFKKQNGMTPQEYKELQGI